MFAGLFSFAAFASVPTVLSYSGHLTDNDTPYEGTITAVFTLFDTATGGTQKWTETHSTVNVNNGLFTVELGSVTDITSVLDGKIYYLQVTINGNKMEPRTPFNSVPYAILSANSNTLGGQTLTQVQSGATPGGTSVTYDNSTSGLTATNMQAVVDELLAKIAALEAQNAAQQTAINTNATAIAANTTNINTNATAIAANTTNITSLRTLTAPITRSGNNMYFTGVNVNIRDGSNSTVCAPAGCNGTGNLIVGYNEASVPGSHKTGSHNLIVGSRHNYTSYGGFVAERLNTISGKDSSVSGEIGNTASGSYSSVSGGIGNTASGSSSSVSGGRNRSVTGNYNWRAGVLSSTQ